MTNIIDFAKAKDLAMLEGFDLNAWLANWHLDRASVETIFASMAVVEADVPHLAYYQDALKAIRERRPELEDPALIDEGFKMERIANDMIILAKSEHIIRATLADEDGPGEP